MQRSSRSQRVNMADATGQSDRAAAEGRPTPVRELIERMVLPIAAVSIATAGVLYCAFNWESWTSLSRYQTTNDASVGADVSNLSARVSGNIRSFLVADYAHVRKGDLIAEIDPSEYEAASALAQAGLLAAEASRSNLERQETLQRAVIQAAEAQQRSAAAALVQTELEFKRQRSLGQVSTEQRLQQAQAAFLQAQAAVEATTASVDQQKAQLEVLDGQRPLLDAQIAAQTANFDAAELHRGFTKILAPFDGVLGKKSAHVGDYVGVGSGIVSIVPLPDVYVTANFKETQLAFMQVGQPVIVRIDTFADTSFRGTVAKLSPASGATFSLLPPDNATGNFTKVIQRLPVRIKLDEGQPLLERLSPGMSAEVTVDTGRADR